MTACGPGCGYCGACSCAWERPAPVLCDGCGRVEVDPDEFNENELRLCARCELGREEALRDEAADQRREWFDRR